MDELTRQLKPALQVQQARERLGLSPEQLGLAIGVSGNTVRRWEAGTYRIHWTFLKRIDALTEAHATEAKQTQG